MRRRNLMGLLLAATAAMALSGCAMFGNGASKMVIRVDCANDKDYTDKAGNKWLADQMWKAGAQWGAMGGETVTRTHFDVKDSPCPEIYVTERWGMDGYKFALPNGAYIVRLHFCETYDGITAAGERVLAVAINGKTVLPALDIFKETGGLNKPLIKTFKGVSVDKGELLIKFTEQAQAPEINGIEIMAE
ncbi:MAG: malectin domain-containing carbohydrate-binding protein [Candidatus Sumerlaeota bacterium]|nr:malectin domain-containing carbohydrate-binding protein [Candidatus Sumerlaeota bacterium]